jgi:Thioredoxin-like domain
MAIATVDCTIEVALCQQRFQITGYPTLMYAQYGRVEDLPLHHDRSVDDYVDFARRISLPAVSFVQSMEEAHRFAKEQGVKGVAFVAYHPDAVAAAGGTAGNIGDTSIGLLKTFQQASKRLHRYSSFAIMLQPSLNDEGALLLSEGPFICRFEEAVPTRCYHLVSETLLVELDSLLDWIERERMPTVSRLTASDLEEVGSKGRVLCIALYRDPDDAHKAEQAIREFATTSDVELRERYYYGIMDATTYESYLQRLGFETSSAEPHIVLKNWSTTEFWQDASYRLDITRFLYDVESGVIPSQSKRKNKQQRRQSMWTRLKIFFDHNRPWSYLVVIGQFVSLFTLLQRFVKVRESLRPPYPRSAVATSSAMARPLAPNKHAVPTKTKDQ